MCLSDESSRIEIGARVPVLEFKDIRYLRQTLDDLSPGKVLVLTFTKVDCPISNRYWPTLKKLAAEFQSGAVQFVGVNVGSQDSIQDIAELALDYEIEFPMVKDFDAKAARQLGIERVPEVAVILSKESTQSGAPREWQLVYRGRIDNQHRFGGSQPKATQEELRDVLQAVLSGQQTKVGSIPADGCLISFDEPMPHEKEVTYAEHIAPLLKKHCVDCHRRDTAAPFELRSFHDVVAHADMIAEVVREQRMPPWYGSAKFPHFINRRGLSADERATILSWVRTGKLRGDDTTTITPAVPSSAVDKWLIGKPDLVLTEVLSHQLPADGIIPYHYAAFPHVFLDETWLEAIQIVPDNPTVVHHCNAGFVRLGEKITAQNFLTGFVPGGQPMVLPESIAARIPAGSVVGIQTHFVTTGKRERCRISIGFKFASKVIRKQLRFELLDDHRFTIPPGASMHAVSASRILEHDAVGVGLFGHMHLRGRAMTFFAHRPGAKSEKLLVIPNFNFGWQHGYQWDADKFHFPKGTRLEVVARYDNSRFNPFNPDSTATVKEGPQSFDEMINGFVFYVHEHENLQLTIDPQTGTARR